MPSERHAILQKEIEADTGIRFGIVEKYQFAAIPVTDESGRTTALGVAQSEAIWSHLKESGYVDARAGCRTPCARRSSRKP